MVISPNICIDNHNYIYLQNGKSHDTFLQADVIAIIVVKIVILIYDFTILRSKNKRAI